MHKITHKKREGLYQQQGFGSRRSGPGFGEYDLMEKSEVGEDTGWLKAIVQKSERDGRVHLCNGGVGAKAILQMKPNDDALPPE